MTSPPSARALALDALVRVEEGAYSNIVLPAMLRESSLSARDRAFVTNLVYGTIRRTRALDHVLGAVAERPLTQLDPPVRAALRLGAAQLLDGVSAHAAVSETVEAAGPRAPRARGFVNAVLRKLARLGPPWPLPQGDTVDAVAVRTSHPDWIVERLYADLGPDDAAGVLASDNLAPAVTLRVNRRRTTVDDVAAELTAGGAHVSRGALVPDALVVSGTGDPAALPAVAEGRATPQDQASQAVVALLDLQPSHRVLDVAAGPGGKAAAAGEIVGEGGLVVAVELHPARTRLTARAARRLGVMSVDALAADARRLPVRATHGFDRVLVDAPCSGLGVLRRRPEARFRIQPGDVDTLARRQRELLAAAVPHLRPGGRLVYSVCTLTNAETVEIDEWVADAFPQLVPEPPPAAPWRPRGRGALLLPQAAGTDGMFVLTLRSVGS
ncbi:MAG: 16S rRNA (cytosine(967)-C(5))-methyltransferase RsmB [Actinobacteria bacterium]|nr:16S rRNA (cytosine(967)-C(5))-methyltransferase RsmB [Actinomycetota bacterium]